VDESVATLPKVQLNRMQTLRLIAVGIAVAFMLLRVVPDGIRLMQPLGAFGYATDDNGVVVKAPAVVPKGTDPVLLGDRIRVDRILPFDRKPGIARIGFTRDNFDRRLPVERNGKERVLTLKATAEPIASRAVTLLRILIYLVVVAFGALLLIVKPRMATFAFFVFCLGGNQPTTYTDVLFDVPWREIPLWIGDTVSGAAPAGLLMFAFCLAVENHRARVIGGITLALAALGFGTLHAFDSWRIIYAGLPSGTLAATYARFETVANSLTAIGFAVAFVRAHGVERQRTGWIVCAFALAGGGRIVSERFFPELLNFWENGALLSLSIIPVIVVWIAIVKHHFFDIDFVVSRALVYVAISAAVIGVVGSSEELLTYIFYNNTDLAYGVIIVIAMGIGACFGKVQEMLGHFVDRFVFRERRDQRRALERVAANLLDAEDTETVYQVLLHDIPSILDLSFSGIMMRTADGGYYLAHQWQWPPECVDALSRDHQLTRDIDKARGILPSDAVRSTMIKSLFPNDRLTYAAPLFFDRSVTALVLYGHSVSGLDIDPEERTVLMRVMSNASIALGAIELARYRKLAAANRHPEPVEGPLPSPSLSEL
jgi:hypothetical protein